MSHMQFEIWAISSIDHGLNRAQNVKNGLNQVPIFWIELIDSLVGYCRKEYPRKSHLTVNPHAYYSRLLSICSQRFGNVRESKKIMLL